MFLRNAISKNPLFVYICIYLYYLVYFYIIIMSIKIVFLLFLEAACDCMFSTEKKRTSLCLRYPLILLLIL